MTFEGRIWRFGDDVNTDQIIPGRYLDNYDPKHLASHAMEGLSKEFAGRVSKGDVIVAGKNFGCGSSREQAVVALRQAGISAVVAKSFARIFYRNAFNLGLPAIISRDACNIFQDGDVAVLDIETNLLLSQDGSKKARVDEIPANLKDILRDGGLVPYLHAKMGPRKREQ